VLFENNDTISSKLDTAKTINNDLSTSQVPVNVPILHSTDILDKCDQSSKSSPTAFKDNTPVRTGIVEVLLNMCSAVGENCLLDNPLSSTDICTKVTSSNDPNDMTESTKEFVKTVSKISDAISNPSKMSLSDLAAYCCSQPVYGNESDLIHEMTGEQNDLGKYTKTKKYAIDRFFKILSGHKVLCVLTELVPHPEIKGLNIIRLLRDVSGTKTDAKKKILNCCLMVFMMNFQKKSSLKEHSIEEINGDMDLLVHSLYQPNMTETEFKYIFAYLHDHGVLYKLRDFPGEGIVISLLLVQYFVFIVTHFLFIFLTKKGLWMLISNTYSIRLLSLKLILVAFRINLNSMILLCRKSESTSK